MALLVVSGAKFRPIGIAGGLLLAHPGGTGDRDQASLGIVSNDYSVNQLAYQYAFAQNDFKKVLVITHIPELKEVFPVRIEVRKTPRGSVFQVV